MNDKKTFCLRQGFGLNIKKYFFYERKKKLKKVLSLVLVGALALSLAACSQPASEEKSDAAETVVVSVPDAEGNMVDVEFPANAERVVVLNHQTMDFLDAVGMADKVVGYLDAGASVPEHLKKYAEDEKITHVGSMKEIDMEAVMSLEPDIIFSSDRTRKMYDEFSAIAPTYSAAVDYKAGFMNGYKTLAATHGKIFGVEGEVDKIIAGYDERIAKIAEFSKGKTALLGIFAGGLNTLGNEGRASIIVNEMGFTNLQLENVNHGNVSSYEAWLELNPDWMFILDKDSAVGTEAVAAKEQMEVNNPVIAETSAFKNKQIVYLEPGTAWYVADGGITSLDLMISCIEKGIGLTK